MSISLKGVKAQKENRNNNSNIIINIFGFYFY